MGFTIRFGGRPICTPRLVIRATAILMLMGTVSVVKVVFTGRVVIVTAHGISTATVGKGEHRPGEEKQRNEEREVPSHKTTAFCM